MRRRCHARLGELTEARVFKAFAAPATMPRGAGEATSHSPRRLSQEDSVDDGLKPVRCHGRGLLSNHHRLGYAANSKRRGDGERGHALVRRSGGKETRIREKTRRSGGSSSPSRRRPGPRPGPVVELRADLSRRLQRSLLPGDLGAPPGMEVAAPTTPWAPDGTGRRHVRHLVPRADGLWGLAIADAAGTGPERPPCQP